MRISREDIKIWLWIVLVLALTILLVALLTHFSPRSDLNPTQHFIESYEQHPAGIDETWYVVQWLDRNNEPHSIMLHSKDALLRFKQTLKGEDE